MLRQRLKAMNWRQTRSSFLTTASYVVLAGDEFKGLVRGRDE